MKQNFYSFLTLLTLVLLVLVGCKKEDISPAAPEVNLPENFVSQDAAAKILSQAGQVTKTKAGADAPFTDLESITPYNGSDLQPAFYVINYKNGGFVILSADDRISPVLAYSEKGKFTSPDGNLGLTMWVNETKNGVTGLRNSNDEQSEIVASQWQPENISAFLVRPLYYDSMPLPPLSDCYCETTTIGPLLTNRDINWHQNRPYNMYAPTVYDDGKSKQGSAGCVPVAMGMIMAYHSYPDRYNYNTYEGQALLLQNLGTQLGAEYNWSGTSVERKHMSSTFTSWQMGYVSADDGDFQLRTVTSNLAAGLPVILSAGSKGGSWLFPEYQNGHAWVCEGYRSEYICNGHQDMGTESRYITYLYMNWGWGGHDNAYYSANKWNPSLATNGGYEYDYEKFMVYNIKPR